MKKNWNFKRKMIEMKDINRSIIVIISNFYMLLNSIVVCVDFHLNEKYIGLQSVIFIYIILILIVLLAITILLLSWESKQMKYEDENKGYFCWLGSFIFAAYLFYKTMLNFKYIWILTWFAIIFSIEVIYLQKKLNRKKKHKLPNGLITNADYLKAMCVINGLQCFIIIIFWNLLQTRICALIFAIISFFYVALFDYIVMSEIINIYRLINKNIVLFTDFVVLIFMVGYQIIMIIQSDHKLLTLNDYSFCGTFLVTIINMGLLILQVVRWKALFAFDDYTNTD